MCHSAASLLFNWSSFICFSSSFAFCLSSLQSSSSKSESSVFRFGVDCAQMGHCSPHPHNYFLVCHSAACLLFTWSSFICFSSSLPLLLFVSVFIAIFFLPIRIFCFQVWVDCAQMGHYGPHPCNSFDGAFGIDLLFWAELPRTIGHGVTACFGGTLSALGLSSILMKAGIGISFPFRGIDHNLATNNLLRPEWCSTMEYHLLLVGWQMWQ